MKADDKVKYEDDNGKEDFESHTNFELLKAQVETLMEEFAVVAKILKQKELHLNEKILPEEDIQDAAYRKLEE